jgi:repressor LexA
MKPTAAPAYPPTKRQQDALRFIEGKLQATGLAPTLAETSAALGMNTRSSTLALLRGLVERGLIRRLPNRARAIEVLADISIPRSPTGEPLYFVRVP